MIISLHSIRWLSLAEQFEVVETHTFFRMIERLGGKIWCRIECEDRYHHNGRMMFLIVFCNCVSLSVVFVLDSGNPGLSWGLWISLSSLRENNWQSSHINRIIILKIICLCYLMREKVYWMSQDFPSHRNSLPYLLPLSNTTLPSFERTSTCESSCL